MHLPGSPYTVTVLSAFCALSSIGRIFPGDEAWPRAQQTDPASVRDYSLEENRSFIHVESSLAGVSGDVPTICHVMAIRMMVSAIFKGI